MKEQKLIKNIRLFCSSVVILAGLYFIYDFFFERLGEELQTVDWLFLVLGVFFIFEGCYFIYGALKVWKEKQKENI